MSQQRPSINRQPLVSVVIPYYQREKGVLLQCVRSILAQEGSFGLEVVIVDDGSPIPAEDDLDELRLDPRVRIVHQENAGASAARNKALDNVHRDADYIALIDSDDAWERGFVSAAVETLELGYDLFFCDTIRFSRDKSRFNWEADSKLNLYPVDHFLIDEESAVYEYKGDFFDYVVRRSSILSSSALVFRRSIAENLRFNQELRSGEDRLFKLHLCKSVKKAAFSGKILCIEGRGVNIFDSVSWGTERSILLNADYIKMSKLILGGLALDVSQRRYVEKQLSTARRDFVSGVFSALRNKRSFLWRDIAKVFIDDPRSFVSILFFVAKKLRF